MSLTIKMTAQIFGNLGCSVEKYPNFSCEKVFLTEQKPQFLQKIQLKTEKVSHFLREIVLFSRC